jgi:uncharacterized protein
VDPLVRSLEPLSDAETQTLRNYLLESGGASLEYARGVFTAVACSPQVIDPPTWLPWVLGSSTPSKTTLRDSFSLLMREAHSIAECLALGEPWFPTATPRAINVEANNAELVQYCKGFTRVTQHGVEWRKAGAVFLKVLPIAATAGYIDVTSIAAVLPGQPDAQQWLHAEQEQLRERVLEIYTAFAEARVQASAAAAQSSGSVGRNEPCPCGSGKKYKKCCAV